VGFQPLGLPLCQVCRLHERCEPGATNDLGVGSRLHFDRLTGASGADIQRRVRKQSASDYCCTQGRHVRRNETHLVNAQPFLWQLLYTFQIVASGRLVQTLFDREYGRKGQGSLNAEHALTSFPVIMWLLACCASQNPSGTLVLPPTSHSKMSKGGCSNMPNSTSGVRSSKGCWIAERLASLR
jgi:hypothetical protein